jgi:RNA polymerase sigma factor for flagellar operon FliA
MSTADLGNCANYESLAERNELVLQQLPQVYYLASRIHERVPATVELKDLVQAGVIGLIEACRSYDSAKDTQFSTFAAFRIRGAILDSLRKLDWGSRKVRRQGRVIALAVTKLDSTLGRAPLEEEIASHLQMELNELRSIMGRLDGLCVVGQLASSSSHNSEAHDLIESAPSAGGENPFELCLEAERKAQLAEAVSHLSEREQLILSLYYKEELTMKEIARSVGNAVSRISQIHSAAMVKLRASVGHLRNKPAHLPAYMLDAGRLGNYQLDSSLQ